MDASNSLKFLKSAFLKHKGQNAMPQICEHIQQTLNVNLNIIISLHFLSPFIYVYIKMQ